MKEIAKKVAALPKENEKHPRMVVVTHGKEPTIVVQSMSYKIRDKITESHCKHPVVKERPSKSH